LPATAGMSAESTSCCNSYGLLGWLTVVPVVADDATPVLLLLTNWCYTKMSRLEIIVVLNNAILFPAKKYQNWLMSVEDIASQNSVVFEHD